MSVLNWIVSQFDYLFFIQGVPATPTVTAKTTTTTKTFIGNGTTEMIYYKEYFAVHTGLLPTMTIRIKLTLRNKGFFFYWTGKGPFFALVSLNEFAKLFCELIAWYSTTINDQQIHLLSRSWPFVTNNICISTGTKFYQNASILKDKNRNMSSLFSNALILIKCSITVT